MNDLAHPGAFVAPSPRGGFAPAHSRSFGFLTLAQVAPGGIATEGYW